MTPKVTVIARAENNGAWLASLVRSLDAQTVPYDEFETLFVVPDVDTVVGQRLARLARRRPNVVVRAGTDLTELSGAVSGTWVLDLGRDIDRTRPVLFPNALARLAEFGSAQAVDAVLARTVPAEGWLVNDFLIADHPRVDPDAARTLGAAPLRLVRRDLATSTASLPDLLGEGRAVGVLGSYPTAVTARTVAPSDVLAAPMVSSVLEWQSGRLRVAVDVSAQSFGGDEEQVFLALTHVRSRMQLFLPARTEVGSGGRVSAEAEIDVRSAAESSQLADGEWRVHVGVHGRPGVWRDLAPLPRSGVGPAVVDGILIASSEGDGGLILDVGARSTSLVGTLAEGAVQIAETATGTKLSASLDHLAASGDSRTPSVLFLGDFPLPAHLIAEGGRVRLDCLVSGLAGSSALSIQVGDGERTPAGLTLVIAPTGGMTVVKTPAAAPKTQAAPSSESPRAKTPAPTPRKAAPLGQRMRRAVPESLEPAARRLARVRLARRVYQAATGLPKGDPRRDG